MDIVAHGLWAALVCRWREGQRPMKRATKTWTVGLAMAPDVVQLAPIVIGALVLPEGWSALQAYVHALPHYQPVLPPMVEVFMHHLHCTMHSAIVAGIVTLLTWKSMGRFWWPLIGWWSHVVIDVLPTQPTSTLRPFCTRSRKMALTDWRGTRPGFCGSTTVRSPSSGYG